MGRNDEDIKEIDSLEDTIVFNVEKDASTKELNVIKEKNEVVDFTSPVEVLSDIKENDESKNSDKPKAVKSKKIKDKKKLFNPISFWMKLSVAKKIISVIPLILFIIIGLIFLLKDDKKDVKVKPKDVVVEADNYKYQNGTLILKGADKKEIGKYECQNKDEKKCFVAYLSNEDDFSGNIYQKENGEKVSFRSKIINDTYVFIIDNKKGSQDEVILYNLKNKKNVDTYKLVKEYDSNKNLVVLKDKDGKYGVLDLSDAEPKTIINFVYSYAGILNNEMGSKYLVVAKNDKYYISDYEEKLVSGGLSNKVVEYNDNFIVTKDSENKYRIYDFDARQLKEGSYLYIKLLADYYALVLENGVYVYDKEGTKYNELPIALTSTNYNKVHVFDANNQLISTDQAFDMAVEDDYVSITRGKGVEALSIKEAKANKIHRILSYYNGIIYFYKDETKKELLGKYTCKNKNTPGEFDHCTIAASSSFSNNDMTNNVKSGYIQLINNRYVFVKDTLSTGGVYLYDLSQSKKLGPYIDVETYDVVADAEGYKNINGLFVIAKNTKNMFGLLKINNQSVDVALGFDYPEMEKEGDYFLVRNQSGKYVLYNNSMTPVTKELDNKIVSYNDNYLLTRSGSGYSIYKHDGTKVDEKAYSYIKLESNFYVGILNNNLGIYKYNNPGVNLLQSSIPIKSSEGIKYNSFYKVSASQLGYEVTITDGEHDKVYLFNQDGVEVSS